MKNYWQTARRKIYFREKTLVMAILNVTPDSFSDGGRYFSTEKALEQAEKLIGEGTDILDVGGESTRPGGEQVSAEEETRRVVKTIAAISERFDVPVSIDTTKSEVAAAAVDAGAEIINDISGLRFDARIGEVAARTKAGLVLMHSRGEFATMHTQPPVENILAEVAKGFCASLEKAMSVGVEPQNIALDVGIGFGKTLDDNLELLAKLNEIACEFATFPLLVGASRKSFIGKVSGDVPANARINGSLAAAAIAAWNGAHIARVHDVRATVEALKIVDAVKKHL